MIRLTTESSLINGSASELGLPRRDRLNAAPRHAILEELLDPGQRLAAERFVLRVVDEVPAELIEAALFGSAARAEARADSDLDILLVFRELPPDREPQAGMAERIAREVASMSGVPLTVWPVALPDLEPGNRTPMLVDALEDAVLIWCWPAPLEPVRFTFGDALRCSSTLLERVREGSAAFGAAFRAGDIEAAARRMRDDIVRLCTAVLLLEGITRPRHSAAVRTAAAVLFPRESPPRHVEQALRWAERSFGPGGRDETSRVVPPDQGFAATAAALVFLQRVVAGTVGQNRRMSVERASRRQSTREA